MPSLKRFHWFIKLTQWEYWPMWIFYAPVWIQHIWLSLRWGNPFFFLATNPAIEGFILSDSKFQSLQLVPAEHRPRTILVDVGTSIVQVLKEVESHGIQFPVIVKPDIGFRGIKVEKVENERQLKKVLRTAKVKYLLQEYCAEPMEFGIFYYRYPNESKGHIPSVTIKEFLKVTGDGQHTMEELVKLSSRALLQEDRLKKRFGRAYRQVIPAGLTVELEPVGNHNRGTRFIDATHLVDKPLLNVFDRLSHRMDGFYYGRFDIRAESWEAMVAEGKFKILEVNGVGGEPTHIYDPSNSVLKAWKDLCHSWKIAARIAAINMQRGVEKPTYQRASILWRSYKTYRSALLT